jgi:hypothetical protein
MASPFENPTEVNPFENVKRVPVYVPPPQVIVVERVVQQKSKRHRWLEVPGACCMAYFCGPCYMFAHLCCIICRN